MTHADIEPDAEQGRGNAFMGVIGKMYIVLPLLGHYHLFHHRIYHSMLCRGSQGGAVMTAACTDRQQIAN